MISTWVSAWGRWILYIIDNCSGWPFTCTQTPSADLYLFITSEIHSLLIKKKKKNLFSIIAVKIFSYNWPYALNFNETSLLKSPYVDLIMNFLVNSALNGVYKMTQSISGWPWLLNTCIQWTNSNEVHPHTQTWQPQGAISRL